MQQNICPSKRNLGSNSDATHHWLQQRLTAVMLIPLSVWFTWFMAHLFKSNNIYDMYQIIRDPFNFSMAVLFIIFVFFHARIGMKVILEDYISVLSMRLTLIILLELFVLVTVTFSIISLFFIVFAN